MRRGCAKEPGGACAGRKGDVSKRLGVARLAALKSIAYEKTAANDTGTPTVTADIVAPGWCVCSCCAQQSSAAVWSGQSCLARSQHDIRCAGVASHPAQVAGTATPTAMARRTKVAKARRTRSILMPTTHDPSERATTETRPARGSAGAGAAPAAVVDTACRRETCPYRPLKSIQTGLQDPSWLLCVCECGWQITLALGKPRSPRSSLYQLLNELRHPLPDGLIGRGEVLARSGDLIPIHDRALGCRVPGQIAAH